MTNEIKDKEKGVLNMKYELYDVFLIHITDTVSLGKWMLQKHTGTHREVKG